MTGPNEIGAPIHSRATGAAEHNPNAAAPDIFAASVNHAANETAHCDRLATADLSNLLHNEGDRA